MRVMIMHKTSAQWEAGAVPSPELIATVREMIGRMAAAGGLLAAEGLRASSQGIRVQFLGGKPTATKGPFKGARELPAGFVILKLQSIEEAVAWASRLARILGDVEIDIRPVTEAWDVGIGSKPQGLTTRRFMATYKADEKTESGIEPTAGQIAEMEKLFQDMKEAGVFLSAERFQPSSKGIRLKFADGKRTITDGPFAESKELIAGFVILKAGSWEEVREWLSRYAVAVGADEVDALPLLEGVT